MSNFSMRRRIHRAEPKLALVHALEAVALRSDVVHYRLQAALAARRSGDTAQVLRCNRYVADM